jgi:tetratricopeptide (TPR) repeat protein
VPPDQEAAELSRRGAAAAARGDLEHAIADLGRACELAPDVPDYFYQRGLAYRQNRQPDLALADFDRSLELRPGEAQVLISRAHLLFERGEAARSAADLDAAAAAAARESDLRLQMAQAYVAVDRLDAAVRQYDLWIESHPADARYPAALNGRCWARALEGEALPLALKDCDAAKRSATRSSPLVPKILDSRGLVLLRMGDYGKSVADYDASLKLEPRNPWSLYGRGIDEIREHRDTEGHADLARAEAIWPQVAAEFAKLGITP